MENVSLRKEMPRAAFLFWDSFINLFLCKWLEKYLGSTYTPRWTRRRSRRWLVRWAKATARLKSLWVSSPHPKNSWRRSWMPGSKVSDELSYSGISRMNLSKWLPAHCLYLRQFLKRDVGLLVWHRICLFGFEGEVNMVIHRINVCRLTP